MAGIALDDIAGDLKIDLRANGEALQALRKSVIEAKIALSTNDVAQLNVVLPNQEKYLREITRAQFEQLAAPVMRLDAVNNSVRCSPAHD